MNDYKKKGSSGQKAAYNNHQKSDAEKVLSKLSLPMSAKLVLASILTVLVILGAVFADSIIRAVGLDTVRLITYDDNKAYAAQASPELKLHFIDVGQGDCTIIELPDGKTMIVDGGDNKRWIRKKIISYIETNLPELKYFDYAILTHTDADHCGSLSAVLAKFPAMTIYRPNVIANNKGYVDPAIEITNDASKDDNLKFYNDKGVGTDGVKTVSTAVYRNFIEQAYKPFVINNVTYHPKVIVSDGRIKDRPASKDTQDISGTDGESGDDEDPYSINFFSPLTYLYSDVNDYSNIFIIEYRGTEIFMSGDAEKKAEEIFVETYAEWEFDIDIIKLGHHGSRTSTSKALLELITKESKRGEIKAIASCGLNNKYGHPHQDTLDRLFSLGFLEENILRTDKQGDIVLSVNETNPGIVQAVSGLQEHPLDWNEIKISYYVLLATIWISCMLIIFKVIKTTPKGKNTSSSKGIKAYRYI